MFLIFAFFVYGMHLESIILQFKCILLLLLLLSSLIRSQRQYLALRQSINAGSKSINKLGPPIDIPSSSRNK